MTLQTTQFDNLSIPPQAPLMFGLRASITSLATAEKQLADFLLANQGPTRSTARKIGKLFVVCCLMILVAASFVMADPPQMRHGEAWIRHRLDQMHACDQAYLWHDVLGGRAIHQNSYHNPPNVPLTGNYHPQIQSRFALAKMYMYNLSGPRDETLLDDAATLSAWVVNESYDTNKHTFYFCYNQPDDAWNKTFYPEFNMINVAALLRYNKLRPQENYATIANDVYNTIIDVALDRQYGGFMSGFTYNDQTAQFESNGNKSIYTAGYLGLMMLDAYETTGRKDMLQSAKAAITSCNTHLWDETYGAWYLETNRQWDAPIYNTKYTHVIANMVQANYQLYLNGQGAEYLNFAEEGLKFLIDYNRAPNGLWYRHNTRDGSDPSADPDNPGSDAGPGTATMYDRQMQVIVALCLGWKATGNDLYLNYIDDTLDTMETTHLIDYPVGKNYGYAGASVENTWCHMWGLEAFANIAKLFEPDIPGDANRDGMVDETDAALLAENWLSTNVGWTQGDFNGDNIVNDLDAAILSANWQGAVDAIVPEPGSCALLTGILLGCMIRYR